MDLRERQPPPRPDQRRRQLGKAALDHALQPLRDQAPAAGILQYSGPHHVVTRQDRMAHRLGDQPTFGEPARATALKRRDLRPIRPLETVATHMVEYPTRAREGK